MIAAPCASPMPRSRLTWVRSPILDFSSADEIIRLGYQGAASNAAELRKYALPDDEWQQYLAQREARKRQPETSATSFKSPV